MTLSPAAETLDAALWDFLLAVYDRPGVQAACLEVQDHCDADIVLLLVWAWHLRPGQPGLGAASVAALQAHVAEWRARAILPLRRLRIDLRAPGTLPEPERLALRSRIKALELGAERSEVAMIAAWLAAHPQPGTDPEGGLAALLGDPRPLTGQLDLLRQAALSV